MPNIRVPESRGVTPYLPVKHSTTASLCPNCVGSQIDAASASVISFSISPVGYHTLPQGRGRRYVIGRAPAVCIVIAGRSSQIDVTSSGACLTLGQ